MLGVMLDFIHSVPAVFDVVSQFVSDEMHPTLVVEDEMPEAVNTWIADWATDNTFTDAEDGLNKLWEHVQASDIQNM